MIAKQAAVADEAGDLRAQITRVLRRRKDEKALYLEGLLIDKAEFLKRIDKEDHLKSQAKFDQELVALNHALERLAPVEQQCMSWRLRMNNCDN